MTEAPVATEEPAATEAPPEEAGGVSGTITIWHSLKDNEMASMNEIMAAFQANNPDVQFDVLFVPHEDLRGKFETAAATGSGPTILFGSADWGPPFYDALLVTDLTGMADQALLDSINPAALEAVRYKDALVGMPWGIKGVVLYRNTSIIPEAPATFEEMIAAAQEATQGDVLGADFERGYFFSAAHITGCGGKVMEPNGDPAFNNEAGVCWLNLFKAVQDAGIPGEVNNDNDVNLFKAGKVGMIIDGSWNMASLAEAIGEENLVIDPWPATEGGNLSGFVQTDNIYLSANAVDEDLEAGWAFIAFLLSPESQAILADPTKAGAIPSVTGVEVTNRIQQEASVAFEKGTAFPVIPEMGAYWSPMETAIKSVLDEGADPATALQQAFDAITAAIAEIRGGG
jgi:arabinogalactan oligomer/maltooligosaccharide transport system substrate-binding protein